MQLLMGIQCVHLLNFFPSMLSYSHIYHRHLNTTFHKINHIFFLNQELISSSVFVMTFFQEAFHFWQSYNSFLFWGSWLPLPWFPPSFWWSPFFGCFFRYSGLWTESLGMAAFAQACLLSFCSSMNQDPFVLDCLYTSSGM